MKKLIALLLLCGFIAVTSLGCSSETSKSGTTKSTASSTTEQKPKP